MDFAARLGMVLKQLALREDLTASLAQALGKLIQRPKGPSGPWLLSIEPYDPETHEGFFGADTENACAQGIVGGFMDRNNPDTANHAAEGTEAQLVIKTTHPNPEDLFDEDWGWIEAHVAVRMHTKGVLAQLTFLHSGDVEPVIGAEGLEPTTLPHIAELINQRFGEWAASHARAGQDDRDLYHDHVAGQEEFWNAYDNAGKPQPDEEPEADEGGEFGMGGDWWK